MEEKSGNFGRGPKLHSVVGVDLNILPKRVRRQIERFSDPKESSDWVQFLADDNNTWTVMRTWDDDDLFTVTASINQWDGFYEIESD